MSKDSTRQGGVSAALLASALTFVASSAFAQSAGQTAPADQASVPLTTGMTQIPPPPPYPLVPGGDGSAAPVAPAQVAATTPAVTAPTPPPAVTPPPPPPPYSLPFGLRPIVPVTVLRLDTVGRSISRTSPPRASLSATKMASPGCSCRRLAIDSRRRGWELCASAWSGTVHRGSPVMKPAPTTAKTPPRPTRRRCRPRPC